MSTCLIVQPIHECGVERLRMAGIEARFASSPQMHAVAHEIAGAQAVITRDAGLSAAAIDAATSLLVIANHGIGTNKIDVAHAHALGIPIVYTPNANARSVAEHTIMLMLAVAKRTIPAHHATRTGDWHFKYSGGMKEVSGKTLGLIGFGTIARLVCQMATSGFGMRALVWSPRAQDNGIAQAGARRVEHLDTLLRESDVVSLHRPARPDTNHTLDARAFSLLKPSAIVLNTARGALIDEQALAAALREQRIAGAGLDVFASEPLPPDSELLSLENIVLAPHVAGSTEDALRETALQCADQIIAVLKGETPSHLLNSSIWPRRRVPGQTARA